VVDQLQRLEHPARVVRPASQPAAFGLALQMEGDQPHWGQRLHRPRRRQINPSLFEPAAEKPLNQQYQRRDKDGGL
jgi:hypothetical protein